MTWTAVSAWLWEKGFEHKITFCRTMLQERERELEETEGALDWHRETAEDVVRDFESREELTGAQMEAMRER
jgi:hypothetical protein